MIWGVVLFLPFRPWSTIEKIDHLEKKNTDIDIEVTALIPARNEESYVKNLVESLLKSALIQNVIVVDDESTDDTLVNLSLINSERLTVISGSTPPEGWVGKVWALHQGSVNISTPFVLLIDADIEFDTTILDSILQKAKSDKLQLTSIMALLKTESFWDKIMIPAFIYFFKLLYPFSLSNNPKSKSVAAAAGGFILLETSVLWRIGGFSALKNALIDDCSLAKLVKKTGGKTWIGLSKGIRTKRSYGTLSNIWLMVERTAFTQLNYSLLNLIFCTVIMGLMFFVPLISLTQFDKTITTISLSSIFVMALTYFPIVKYYKLNLFRTLTLPLAGVLFLLMSWSSAIKYMLGKRSEWKGRTYKK